MNHYCLKIAYDGTAYHGFQVQKNAWTVQAALQKALGELEEGPPPVTGCSRTDAGVHARGFCCTTVLAKNWEPARLRAALSAHLPEDVSVLDVCPVGEDFHPRYSAIAKTYCYTIWNHPSRNPFLRDFALHYTYPLDEKQLDAAAKAFCGRHDFAGFQSAGSAVKDTVRTVTDCHVQREGNVVRVWITADGFLYNMVRIIVGTLLAVAGGKIQPDTLPARIASCDRSAAGTTALAKGLCLYSVDYGEELEWPRS